MAATALSAAGQTTGMVRVISVAPVVETARGDGLVLGTIEPGALLEFTDQRGPWYLVLTPGGGLPRQGWIHGRYIEVVGRVATAEEAPVASLGPSVRGFFQAGVHRFLAVDSFEAVRGRSFGALYGGGGQLGWGNLFVQASVGRYQETGQRVAVVNAQLFRLQTPDTVTVTPIQGTIGYRQRAAAGRLVSYVGAGVGVLLYKKEIPAALASDQISEKHLSYHILGGVELPLLSWLWLGGEGQWTGVPDAIGNQGISSTFTEDDLGGFTVRVEVSMGR